MWVPRMVARVYGRTARSALDRWTTRPACSASRAAGSGFTCYARAITAGPLYLRRVDGAGAPATPWRSAIDFDLPVDDGFFLGGYEWAADVTVAVVVVEGVRPRSNRGSVPGEALDFGVGRGYPTCAAHMLVHMLSTKFSLNGPFHVPPTDFGPDGAAIVFAIYVGVVCERARDMHFTAPT